MESRQLYNVDNLRHTSADMLHERFHCRAGAGARVGVGEAHDARVASNTLARESCVAAAIAVEVLFHGAGVCACAVGDGDGDGAITPFPLPSTFRPHPLCWYLDSAPAPFCPSLS